MTKYAKNERNFPYTARMNQFFTVKLQVISFKSNRNDTHKKQSVFVIKFGLFRVYTQKKKKSQQNRNNIDSNSLRKTDVLPELVSNYGK